VASVTIALPDPWVMVDVEDLTNGRLAALPDEAQAIRNVLMDTATRLADRKVGFLALRVLSTENGMEPTGLLSLTLDQSDATNLHEVEERVQQEFAQVQHRVLGATEYIVGVSTESDEQAFVRGDFRLVEDGLLLTVWSAITVMDDASIEHEVLDLIVSSLQLHTTE